MCKLFLDKKTIIYYILGGLFANFWVFLLSFCVFPRLFAPFRVFLRLSGSFRYLGTPLNTTFKLTNHRACTKNVVGCVGRKKIRGFDIKLS